MFSFIHTADIHLDSPLRGLSKHEGAPEELLRGATRKALTNIVDLAIERSVHFVLIAGDLYDGDWPDFNTGHFFNRQMRRLQDADIPVYLISGNHDAASKISKSLQPPSNVHVLSTKKAETLTVANIPCAIHGQGFATQHVQDNLAANYPAKVEGMFNIGMLHTSLAGNPDHDPYAPCSESDLLTKGYDYWALGHIHLHAILRQEPYIVYSGNPQGRHIGETGERGCYLVEVSDELTVASTTFIHTDVVRWETLVIDISQLEDSEQLRTSISERFSKALSQAEGRLLAIRLTLTGATALHDQLHTEQSLWQAECVNIASEIDDELIWFERLRIKTAPTYDPATLAERDELIKLVLDSLDHFDTEQVPPAVSELAGKLNSISDKELSDTLAMRNREEIKEDVTAIVLQSLSSSVSQ
ncbi:metallophosphoesterase family protein [Rubritalea sp.]|uniref:metallophosphoesterase family protein n=1 Tax=Rubritalea sp. TaxID=2109375 RepID=UPI003EF38F86